MHKHQLEDIEGLTKDIQTYSTNTTLGANNDVAICTGTITINLPAAANYTGKEYTIKNKSTGVITVDANGGELIDGATTQSLIEHEVIKVISDGISWWIV